MSIPVLKISLREPATPLEVDFLLQVLCSPWAVTFEELLNHIVKVPGANVEIAWKETDGPYKLAPQVLSMQLVIPFPCLKAPPGR